MPAQHWATSSCRRPSVEQTIGVVGQSTPPPDYRVLRPIKGGNIDLKLCFLCFCILFRISRVYTDIASYKDKISKLKSLIIGVPLMHVLCHVKFKGMFLVP